MLNKLSKSGATCAVSVFMSFLLPGTLSGQRTDAVIQKEFYTRANKLFEQRGLELVNDIDKQNTKLLTIDERVINEKTSEMLDTCIQNIRIVEEVSNRFNYPYGKAIMYKHIGLINFWVENRLPQKLSLIDRIEARGRLLKDNYKNLINSIDIAEKTYPSYWFLLALEEAQKTKDNFLLGEICLLIAEEMANYQPWGGMSRELFLNRIRDSSIIYYKQSLNSIQKALISDSLAKVKLQQIYSGLAFAFSYFEPEYNWYFDWYFKTALDTEIPKNYKSFFSPAKSAYDLTEEFYKKGMQLLAYTKNKNLISKLNYVKCKLFFSNIDEDITLADSIACIASTAGIKWKSSIESWLSQFYLTKKMNDSALKYARLAINHSDYEDPNTLTKDHLSIGKILLLNNKIIESIEHLKEAEFFDFSKNYNYLQIKYQLGEAYRTYYKYDTAIYYFNKAINFNDYSDDVIKANCYFGKYVAADSLKDYAIAINAYRDFLSLDKLTDHKDSAYNILRLEAKNQKQINLLLTEKQAAESKAKNRLIAGTMVAAALLLVVVLMFFRNNNIKLKNQVSETKMRVLLSQLNPHFIFNCLNSINSLIKLNKNKEAESYLVQFSGLTRKILDYSGQDKISLQDEFNFLKEYTELEKMRFSGGFDVEIQDISNDKIAGCKIPALLLQPIVENSINHGLKPKASPGRGILEVKANVDNKNYLTITIKDNGVGFTKSKESKSTSETLKSKPYNSYGMTLTTDRISGLNKRTNSNKFGIEDVLDNNGEISGTLVTITLAIT